MLDSDDDKKYRLFDDDDDDDDNIVLRFDSEKIRGSDAEVKSEEVLKRYGFSKDVLLEFSDKWQIPMFLVFLLFSLLITWAFVRASDKMVSIDYKLSSSQLDVNNSSRHKSFQKALSDTSKMDDAIRVVEQSGNSDMDKLKKIVRIVDRVVRKYDTPAVHDDDRFVVRRMGDKYVEALSRMVEMKPQEVSSAQIGKAIRWSEMGLEYNEDFQRSEEERLWDVISLHEVAGDREKDVEHYEKSLGHLSRLVSEVAPENPRHYLKARLHYKVGDLASKNASREYIDASINSDDPEELKNRFAVTMLLGRMLAEDGQMVEAEKKFSSIIKEEAELSKKAEIYYRLGQVRMELAQNAIEDGQTPLQWYLKGKDAFVKARELYGKIKDRDEKASVNRDKSEFNLGTIELYLGKNVDDGESHNNYVKARDRFIALYRRNKYENPALEAATKVRLIQTLIALGETEESERLLQELLKDSKDKYWNRLNLVTTGDIFSSINDLSKIHEGNEEYNRQVEILNLEKKILDLRDKKGQMRHHFTIAHIWEKNAHLKPGTEARVSYRNSAKSYLDLLDKTYIRVQKQERQDVLWNAYQQFKECYEDENMALWNLIIDEVDKDSAIQVLNRIIVTGESPDSNQFYNQSLYLRGLLQEDLNRYEEAIRTHKSNIDSEEYGGKNVYVYRSMFRRAKVRAKMGGMENIMKAIKNCEELLANHELGVESLPRRNALFLNGELNVEVANRSRDPEAQLMYFNKGIRDLDEAIKRYPKDAQLIKATVTSGLSKMKASKLDPINTVRWIQGAIQSFKIAVNRPSKKNVPDEINNLKKLAWMNIGMGYLELGGENLLGARDAFDRLAHSYRRDRIEPWALIQLHRTYKKLIKYEKTKPDTVKSVVSSYQDNANRVKSKAVSSWDQLNKFSEKKFDQDFPLSYWESNDKWNLDMQRQINLIRERN